MVTEYPPEWPITDGLAETLPTIYLHVLGDVWPPADEEMGTPAGWAQVSTWDIDCELDAPLLPGQINADVKFITASANCTIPQPRAGGLAPWAAGDRRTPKSGHVELVASHNGPLGSTAKVLGVFLLDPIRGKSSDPNLTLKLIQDTVRGRTPHRIPTTANRFAPFSPTRLLELGAARTGFTLDASADFDALVTSSYFPGKTDHITAMQEIVAANLGAMFLSMDGSTIVVKDPDYLLGSGTIVDTLDIEEDLDDLSWTQDPNALIDRIEVSYIPPVYDSSDDAVTWSAPKGVRLNAGASVVYHFDPKHAVFPTVIGPFDQLPHGNPSMSGQDIPELLDVEVTEVSSGHFRVMLTNPTGHALYLMERYYAAGSAGTEEGFPRGTTTFLRGTVDTATDEAMKVMTWGADTEDATSTLTFDLGRNIQRSEDARVIIDRIVERVTRPTYVLEDVRVPLDFRRELADVYRVQGPRQDFDVRAIVTRIKLTGTKDEISQTVTLAAMPLIIRDLNEAWDAGLPGATIADFNAVWAGKTIADFNTNPLRTAP